MKRMALRRILAALCCLALLPVAGCAGGQDVLLADKDGAQALCLPSAEVSPGTFVSTPSSGKPLYQACSSPTCSSSAWMRQP